MWFQSLLDAVLVRAEGQRPNRQSIDRRGRPTRRLLVEGLEDRRLLTFLPAVSYPVGAGPQAIVAADVNNDGHLDLATANPGFHSVSVLLGDGAGGFDAAIDSAGTTNDAFERVSVAVADFNNDGQLDLATAMYGYYEYSTFGRLDVWMGNGDGTFQSPTLVSVGATLAMAAGDFNNDGNSDLVGASDYAEQQGSVWVLPGNGLGGFTSGSFLVGNYAYGLAVGDLNGDGNLDAVAVENSSASAYLGNGAGGLVHTYTSIDAYSSLAAALGDFTGDGILDLVVSGGAVETFTGLGDGFGEPIFHFANGYEHTGVAVADFNGDGLLDAVTSDADTGTVSELLGNGNGTLTYAGAYAVGSSPSAIAVGDFNGDSRPDAATADAGSNTVSVLLNDGDWTPPPPPPPPPPSLRIRDLTVNEGNSGTGNATFTVILSEVSSQDVTVAYATANGTATAGSDYEGASGTVTIPAGQTTGTITVLVIGDRFGETDETYFVNLSGATNTIIEDGQGQGTIVDDEPRISIDDVTLKEGGSGKMTLYTFTVMLSAASNEAVTVNYATANGTAIAGSDYLSKSETVTFAPGETTKTIVISVKGDKTKEADETFFVNLASASGALIADGQGLGTILDDDGVSKGNNRKMSASAVDAAIDEWMIAPPKKRNS